MCGLEMGSPLGGDLLSLSKRSGRSETAQKGLTVRTWCHEYLKWYGGRQQVKREGMTSTFHLGDSMVDGPGLKQYGRR